MPLTCEGLEALHDVYTCATCKTPKAAAELGLGALLAAEARPWGVRCSECRRAEAAARPPTAVALHNARNRVRRSRLRIETIEAKAARNAGAPVWSRELHAKRNATELAAARELLAKNEALLVDAQQAHDARPVSADSR
jgi:hypothetical protein